MRLLRARNYELVEANDIPVPFPQYAILSHMDLSEEEITYQDIKKRMEDIKNDLFQAKRLGEARKVLRPCSEGRLMGLDGYVLYRQEQPADTQEAINAMFRWYQSAGICYAYLEDVDVQQVLGHVDSTGANVSNHMDLDEITGRDNVADPNSFLRKALRPSSSMLNGLLEAGPLQELLAPHYLVFVDRAWRRIGTREPGRRDQRGQQDRGAAPDRVRPTDFYSCSIAMRLSWASRRETTVEEDETYCQRDSSASVCRYHTAREDGELNRLQRELVPSTTTLYICLEAARNVTLLARSGR